MWDHSRGDPVTALIGWMAAWGKRPSDGPSWMGGGGGMYMPGCIIYARVHIYACDCAHMRLCTYARQTRDGPVAAPPGRVTARATTTACICESTYAHVKS